MGQHPAIVSKYDLERILRTIDKTGGRRTIEIEKNGTLRIIPMEDAAPPSSPRVSDPGPEEDNEIVL
jgi:hypothetical protein